MYLLIGRRNTTSQDTAFALAHRRPLLSGFFGLAESLIFPLISAAESISFYRENAESIMQFRMIIYHKGRKRPE